MATAPGNFSRPPQAPPLFNHTTDNLAAAFDKQIEETKKLADELVAKIKPEDATWENYVQPFEDQSNEQALTSNIIHFYQHISPNKALRDQATQGGERYEKFGNEFALRQDLYKLFKSVYAKRDQLANDAELLRYLEKEKVSNVKNGLDLPDGPQLDRFKEMRDRQTELKTRFSRILNEEDGGIWFTPQELDGLPQDVLGRLDKGTGENEGRLRLTFKYPDLLPSQTYCKDGAVRQKIWLGNENRCNENGPVFKELVVLRDEAARILGYPNHATLKLQDKMAKTPETVYELLLDLRRRLASGGQQDKQHLWELKKADLKARGLPSEDEFYIWDWKYYENVQKETEYSVDEQKLSEYFALASTVTAMLNIFEHLFGLRFFELAEADKAAISPSGKAADATWHEDVKMFTVWNDEANGDGFVGYFYLDMHPRPGKYTHAANFNVQPGFLKRDGTRHHPATALVCNFTPPTAEKPSLLKHGEVVTLFHELGHGIHDLVAETKYSRFHGTNTVRDFVEAPSQMLENWCWTPSVLKRLSKHWDTGAVLPDDLIDKLIKTRHINTATFTLRQLQLGLFDMAIHTPKDHEAAQALEPNIEYNRLRSELIPMPAVKGKGQGFDYGHGEATFGHLAGGYDAGYYGYLYSQVYSADMWHTRFKADPMNGEMGRKYRKLVLERGGSRDEMQNLIAFLGRKPNAEAFYKELGLEG